MRIQITEQKLEFQNMLIRSDKDTDRQIARGQSLFEAERIANASWAFTTRRVPTDPLYRISHGPVAPEAGDLVLAKVDVLGHHKGLQLASGRKRNLFAGDEIVFGTESGHVHALSATGTRVRSFGVGSPIEMTPTLADVTGDGRIEILVGSNDGVLRAIKTPGKVPAPIGYYRGDPQNTGMLE